MHSGIRTVLGIALVIIIGLIAWSLVTGGRRVPEVAAPATTTPKTTAHAEEPQSAAPLSARVSVTAPAEGSPVGQSFAVEGKAPGNWFFEASFPIQVRSEAGDILARSHGQAKGEWMTTNLVPFTASITLSSAYHGPALLILMRDNPSGLPENDDSVSIPITIK